MNRALVALALAVPTTAEAGGLALDTPGARAVGRAGAGVVSDDGAAAVAANPAALARRDARRVQLGLVLLDDGARYEASAAQPAIEERGGSTWYPMVGAQGAVGPVVVGLSFLDEAAFARGFAEPVPGQPADDVAELFPHRYAGLSAAHRRHTLAAGAAWRATEWLAVGASLSASRVSLEESRRVWAGFAGRDTIGDASRDVTVRLAGDAFVAGGSLGVLVAPLDTPFELALAASYSSSARLSGEAAASGANPGGPPSVSSSSPTSSVSMSSPLVLRTGARWLAERWIAEVGADLWLYPRDPAMTWSIDGLTVVDDTGATAALDSLPSQVSRRGHGAVRAAVDVAAIPGLLWLTAGYQYATASTPTDRLSPAAADLGGHTVAVGAEIVSDGFTVTLGIARRMASAVDVDVTRLHLDNPFDAGTAPTGFGEHDQSRDTIALTLETEL